MGIASRTPQLQLRPVRGPSCRLRLHRRPIPGRAGDRHSSTSIICQLNRSGCPGCSRDRADPRSRRFVPGADARSVRDQGFYFRTVAGASPATARRITGRRGAGCHAEADRLPSSGRPLPLACSITGMVSSRASNRACSDYCIRSGPAGEDRRRRRASALVRRAAWASVSTCVVHCCSSWLRAQAADACALAPARRLSSPVTGWAAPGCDTITTASGACIAGLSDPVETVTACSPPGHATGTTAEDDPAALVRLTRQTPAASRATAGAGRSAGRVGRRRPSRSAGQGADRSGALLARGAGTGCPGARCGPGEGHGSRAATVQRSVTVPEHVLHLTRYPVAGLQP